MHYYVLTCYIFVLFAIAEYALILLIQDSQELRGNAAKSTDNRFGTALCVSFLFCNVVFIYSMNWH